jgi:hypothetical protein
MSMTEILTVADNFDIAAVAKINAFDKTPARRNLEARSPIPTCREVMRRSEIRNIDSNLYVTYAKQDAKCHFWTFHGRKCQ